MCFPICEKEEMELSPPSPQNELGDFQGTRHWRSMALDTLKPGEISKKFEKGRQTIEPCSLTTEGIALAQPASLYRFLNRGVYEVASLTKSWDDIARPRKWIPVHVNRSFNNLTVDDIKGSRPNPKNMKLGNAARGTNPLEPVYKLPTSKTPHPQEPKFLRDNLNVDDISGARPRQRVKINVDTVSGSEPLEGSFPGWRPTHRRRFGKTVRDLCLQVQDINKPLIRMIRSPNSEAYLKIEGANSKSLKQFRVSKVQKNQSLPSQYIEDIDEYDKIYEVESCDQSLETLKGIAKDLANVFKKMDRDRSGKLTLGEVQLALKKLQLDLNPLEFKSLSSVFFTGIDGYVDYPKLLQTLSPTPCMDYMKRYNPNKLNSRAISLCLNPHIDRPWTIGCLKSEDNEIEKRSKKELDAESLAIDIRPCTTGMDIESRKSTQLSMCCVENPLAENESQVDVDKSTMLGNHVHIQRKPVDGIVSSNAKYNSQIPVGGKILAKDCKFPLQLGLAFWPEEKTLQTQQNARFCLSLPQDYKEAPEYPSKPLADDEKLWETNIGGTTFTGEGKVVNSGSYMHGYDWCRPSMAKTPSKKRRMVRGLGEGQVQVQGQRQTNLMSVPQIEMRASTARTDNSSTTSKVSATPATNKHSKRRPVSASVAQLSRRLLSTSDPRTSHWSRFSSPRSDIIATISTARSSQSARSGIMSSRSYCSPKVNSKNISTTRESLSSRIHSGQNSHRSQTRKEDAAAVRSLL